MSRSATDSRRRLAKGWRAAMALALAGGILAAAPAAQARGFVGLSLGLPLGAPAYPSYYPPPAYYYPPAYYPPPAYYGPPPVAYASPPAYAPPSYATPAAPASSGVCREYQSRATIDGRPQETFGIACRQPDGSWRIVQ